MIFKRLSTISIIPITLSLIISQSNALTLNSNDRYFKSNINSSLNFPEQSIYDKSILISQKTFEKSDNVVIVSRDNTIDNFPATTLASCLDAPILLVDNHILDSTINEISRLKAKNVYIIGEINTDIIRSLKNSLNINVTHIYGKDRFETSSLIANEVKKKTPIKEVFILESNSQVDAITLGSISAKHKIPILYCNKNFLTEDTEDFLKTNKLEKVYLIGNSFNQEVFNSVKDIYHNTELIKGKDRYEINTLLNSKFFSEAEGVIFIDKNNLIDAAPIALTSAKKNLSLLLVHNTLTNNQSKYLDRLNIINLGSVGEVNKGPLLTTLNSLNGISNAKTIFNKGKAVFYIPHQGDETTLFSSSILAAINTLGKENVYVTLITDGDELINDKKTTQQLVSIAKSRNLNFTSQGELNSISSKLIAEARDNEFLEAIKNLGVPLSNVRLVNGISNNKSQDALEYIKSIMTEYNDTFNNDITHITTSPSYSSDSDHINIGRALEELYADRLVNNAYFAFNTDETNKLQGTKIVEFNTTEVLDLSKISTAFNSYKKWDPENLRLSIGYNHNKSEFDNLKKSIKKKCVTTKLHIPTT